MIKRDWHGCYSDSWKGEITDEAFAHPAKFARGLIRQIYHHALEQGYFRPGDLILDPFGGVALGARDAMQLGLNWLGIELEEKFVKLGNENLDLWRFRLRGQTGQNGLPELGEAILFQGDSRYLVQVLADGVVSSPPYMKSLRTPDEGDNKVREKYPEWHSSGKTGYQRKYSNSPANLANLPEGNHAAVVISSPPYAGSIIRGGIELATIPIGERWKNEHKTVRPDETGYGVSPGQLGAMRVVSSPPYAESINQSDGANDDHARIERKRQAGIDVSHKPNVGGPNSVLNKPQVYGKSEGQLGAMKVVSSPPWEKQIGNLKASPEFFGHPTQTNSSNYSDTKSRGAEYGNAPGQLGTETGDDFWTAAQTIMQQTYSVLQSGATAIWVLKAFVRNKEIVDFPDQWRQLGEACGFTTIEWIRAWLIEDRGKQYDLFGELHEKTVERKSFFRRLAENKGSPRIDFEVVLIQQK